MHRGQEFEDLKQQLIAAAMRVGLLTAQNPLFDARTSPAQADLDRLSKELSAEYNRAEAPFRKGDRVRPKLNSLGYVELLERLGRDAAIVRRSDQVSIQDMLYHGKGHWSLQFVDNDHRYPAEEFELVPVDGSIELGRPRKSKRCARIAEAA